MNGAKTTWAVRLAGLAAAIVATSARADDLLLRTGEEPDVLCVNSSGVVNVTLEVADLSAAINGVQALISYDTAVLSLDTATPDAAWTPSIFHHDAVSGDIDFAAIYTVNTNGTGADSVIATLSFNINPHVAPAVTTVGFRANGPVFMNKLTVAADNSTILPTTFESGGIRVYDADVDCCSPSDGVLTPIDDGVTCTVDTCNPLDGSVVHATSDGLCNDSVSCTVDSCDLLNDCQFVPSNGLCNDGVNCTSDACNATTGCASVASNGLCDDGVGCTDDVCDAFTGCSSTSNDANCDDGLFCNGAETCDAQNDCQAGTAPDCTDEDPCTADACNEAADACTHDDTTFVDVNLEVEAVGAAVTRDVTFVLTDCDGASEIHTLPVSIDSNGLAAITLTGSQLDDFRLSDYIQATEGHTLSRQLELYFDGEDCFATADFVGADRLIAGDFQTADVAHDNLVDIVDFSILASRWNTNVRECDGDAQTPDPNCGYGADATADGIQNIDDFTAVQINFFEVGDSADACGMLSYPVQNDLSRLSAATLVSAPVAQLQPIIAGVDSVDANGDAVIDVRDIRAFVNMHRIPVLPAFEEKMQQLEQSLNLAPERQTAVSYSGGSVDSTP